MVFAFVSVLVRFLFVCVCLFVLLSLCFCVYVCVGWGLSRLVVVCSFVCFFGGRGEVQRASRSVRCYSLSPFLSFEFKSSTFRLYALLLYSLIDVAVSFFFLEGKGGQEGG